MFDSYDRSSPQYLKYKNATMVLIGRWLNGIPAPQGVRIYLAPDTDSGAMTFLEEHTAEWLDWSDAVKKTERRARHLIDEFSTSSHPIGAGKTRAPRAAGFDCFSDWA